MQYGCTIVEKMKKLFNKAAWLLVLICIIVFVPVSGTACIQLQQTQPAVQPASTSQIKPVQAIQFKRSTTTAPNIGAPCVIFRVDDVARGQYEDITERIIRIFAKNNAPLDIGVIPHASGQDSFEIPYLRTYLDAGVIDITMHGYQHTEAEFNSTDYETLKNNLIHARSQYEQYFGFAPVAFTTPYDFFSTEGYKAVQDAGFKIFSTQKSADPFPSVQPVDVNGIEDYSSGMSRLCTVTDVAQWDAASKEWGDIYTTELTNEFFGSIDWGLKNLGVAVVGVHPQAFLKADDTADTDKLDRLDAIVKAVRQRNSISTFEAWYTFATSAIIGSPYIKTGKTPAIKDKPGIIFRLDDVERGVREDTVEEIIKIFQRNGVPLDVGVMPFAAGHISYNIPMLLKYLDLGVIDISVHGYTNSFAEFDTEISGASFDRLDPALKPCFENQFGQFTYKPKKTYYDELLAGLTLARERYRRYFGIAPIAFTVPNDFFNEEGYRAAQLAGFKIFSSQQQSEKHPSDMLLDYFGRPDENGMYRLPAFASISDWDSAHCRFGDLLTLESPEDQLWHSIMYSINSSMHLAVVYLHPQNYDDSYGRPDRTKLNKLDTIIKFIKDHSDIFYEITTFQSWYEWKMGQDLSE